ncbi:hypothetical protein GDO86_015786 [Hymenochirus boettgeri]|uniref:Uncharacterized protein n=1 Tax=Hymenochirus boettgeri TaxID=247094 RepID=A0A8T2JZB3_9PIPI|nr:hypothetical protein GDO86_015786 [Hymenochirus boettgeri]
MYFSLLFFSFLYVTLFDNLFFFFIPSFSASVYLSFFSTFPSLLFVSTLLVYILPLIFSIQSLCLFSLLSLLAKYTRGDCGLNMTLDFQLSDYCID